MKRILKELELTHIASVDSPCQELALATITKRDFSDKERDKLSDTGAAMPDGSYPIKTTTDLDNAIKAYGRASNPDAVKRHIIRRARSLGATAQLPPDWKVSKFADTPKEDLQIASLVVKAALLKARVAAVRPKGATHTTVPYQRGEPDYFTGNPSSKRARRVNKLERRVAKMKKTWSDAARAAALEARRAHAKGGPFSPGTNVMHGKFPGMVVANNPTHAKVRFGGTTRLVPHGELREAIHPEYAAARAAVTPEGAAERSQHSQGGHATQPGTPVTYRTDKNQRGNAVVLSASKAKRDYVYIKTETEGTLLVPVKELENR